MKDQSKMMNQSLMNQPQMMSQPPHLMNQQPPVMNQPPMMSQSQMVHHAQVINNPQVMSQSQLMMSQSQPPPPPMMNRPYQVWQQQQLSMDPNPNKMFQNSVKPNFGTSKPGRSNWKNKKGADKRKDLRRMEKPMSNTMTSGPTGTAGYKPPTLHELQSQNRLKARKFYPKKKFNNRFAPYAPRNTTSFIIRAKKAGGITSLVSPCPVTPAVLPTPIFSPSREVLGDMAKEEWGVDGYGSMKGLIRLRSPGNEGEMHEEDEEEEGGGSSDSDVEEHVEVERRLDHDLSRFEMIYPNYGVDYNNVLENRVDDQDSHIVQLEEENLTLKERLFLMEREMGDLRRRLQFLERQNQVVVDVNEEVVENGSDNESEGVSDVHSTRVDNNEEVIEYVSGNRESPKVNFEAKEEHNERTAVNKSVEDVSAAFVTTDMVSNERDLMDKQHGNKFLAAEVVAEENMEEANKFGAGEETTQETSTDEGTRNMC